MQPTLAVPFVSVIIPAYRVTAYIAETLDSVLNQTVRDLEVIVVNDCCPDSDCLEIALEPYFARILYLKHDTNRGPAAARNTGIRSARGEWIAFLDGDDIWFENYLEVQTAMIANCPEASVIYGNARIMGSRADGKDSQALSPSTGEVTLTAMLNETVVVALLNVSKRSSVLDAGCFDESIRWSEDFDLWVRMVRNGAIFRYHSQVIAGYRKHSASLTADPTNMHIGRMKTLAKLESDASLQPEERSVVRTLQRRWTAELDLYLSKLCIDRGQPRQASAHLRSANVHFRKPRLYVIQMLMQFCPLVVLAAVRWRRHSMGF